MKILIMLCAATMVAHATPTCMSQAHNDASQTGVNSAETALTTASVSSQAFERLGSWAVDGVVFAQPLVCSGVVIGGALRNLLIVATMNNSIYAFDANWPGVTVWSNLAFATPYSDYPQSGGGGLYGPQGCLSTPVVDPAGGYIYAVCENSTPNWILRQISLTTGATLQSATVTGQVIGSGDAGSTPTDPTSGPNLLFFPAYEFQRTALTLANGNVYFGFGNMNDIQPWHGWLFAYAVADLSQVGVFCSTPNSFGGGFWQSGGSAAVDGDGNLYMGTGNGGCQYDGSYCWTNTTIKFGHTLAMIDWFTPSNNVSINNADADVSSNRTMLVGSSVVYSAKDFNVYTFPQNCMGHLQGSGSGCALTTWVTNSGGTVGANSGAFGAALFPDRLVLPTTQGFLYGYVYGSGSFTTAPYATQTSSYGFPGPAQMAGSSNGTTNEILWIATATASAHATERAVTFAALDAVSFSTLFTDSPPANLSKFTAPTVFNGRVFLPTNNAIYLYGIPTPATGILIGRR